jgi:hypothetical protein
LGADKRGHENQIEQGDTVDHVKAEPIHTSKAPETAGRGREREVARRSLGGEHGDWGRCGEGKLVQ